MKVLGGPKAGGGVQDTCYATVSGKTGRIGDFSSRQSLTLYDTGTGAKLAIPSSLSPDGSSFSVTSTASLVAYWPAENNYDDIFGRNNGTPCGGGTPCGVSFSAGEFGQAFGFNGTTGYVDIQSQQGLSITGSISVAAWVKPNVTVTLPGEAIFSEMSSSDDLGEVELRINPEGDFGWFRRPTSGSNSVELVSTNTKAVSKQWQYVVGVYDDSNASYKVYINGVLDTATPISVGSGGAGSDPLIGTDSQFTEWSSGLIDEVQVFGRALSSQEIQAIYNAGKAGVYK